VAYEERRERLRTEAAAKEAEYKQLVGRLEAQLDFAEKRAGAKAGDRRRCLKCMKLKQI
jgi:hypothetical protein